MKRERKLDARSTERLERAFFARDTALVARSLIGQRLVSYIGGRHVEGEIVETEAYVVGDSTNHATRGRTNRNASMFAAPGVAYVYFTYGMHYCMNVSTGSEGLGVAVLIRALAPEVGIDSMRARRGERVSDRDLCRGPARLCVALGIDRVIDGVDTCGSGASIVFAPGRDVDPSHIVSGPRVGVVGHVDDVTRPLRFHLRDSPYVSNGPRVPRTPRS